MLNFSPDRRKNKVTAEISFKLGDKKKKVEDILKISVDKSYKNGRNTSLIADKHISRLKSLQRNKHKALCSLTYRPEKSAVKFERLQQGYVGDTIPFAAKDRVKKTTPVLRCSSPKAN